MRRSGGPSCIVALRPLTAFTQTCKCFQPEFLTVISQVILIEQPSNNFLFIEWQVIENNERLSVIVWFDELF